MKTLRHWFRRQPDSGPPTSGEDPLRTTFEWTYEPRGESDGRDPSRRLEDERAAGISSATGRVPAHHAAPARAALALLAADQDGAAHRESDGEDPESAQPSSAGIGRLRPEQSYLRHQLDEALARWWKAGTMPSAALLRAGLTALENGQYLDAELRSLLLRTALYHRRGVVTALRHQDDPERTGLVLAEALAAADTPEAIELVKHLIERDPGAAQWRPALLSELRASANGLDEARRTQALQALRSLTSAGTAFPQSGQESVATSEATRKRSAWPRQRQAYWLIALLFVLGAGLFAAVVRQPSAPMVDVAGGEYRLVLGGAGNVEQRVVVEGFAIDQYEVTNRQYRGCYERGRCDWPASSDAAGIENYFVNPAYDRFPVVNVNWDAAAQYCQWLGKRLPTEEEWQVAAAAAPATGQLFAYPWGNSFASSLANTEEAGRGQPAVVGSRSPAGDSPSGAADMAGNAAEWSATIAGDTGDMVVKGGSYRDGHLAALAAASRLIPPDATEAWIGFRCVAD